MTVALRATGLGRVRARDGRTGFAAAVGAASAGGAPAPRSADAAGGLGVGSGAVI
jgi:hypothetical protein